MIPVPRQDFAPAETPGYGQPRPAHSADLHKRPGTESIDQLTLSDKPGWGAVRAGEVNHPDHDYGDDAL
jgi:hypothetical protein